jgi:hypothetical protein
LSQIPSYLISQGRGVTPIQVQNAIGWAVGEINWFDAISKGAGFYTSSTYPRPDSNWWDDLLKSKEEESLKAGGRKHRRIKELKKRLNKYKQRIDRIKLRPETKANKTRIADLEIRRSELAKKHLK